jgi:hypothetical protein
LFEGGQNPGHDNERKKEADHHTTETEFTEGHEDNQIDQSKDKQGRQTAFGGPETLGMEF